MHEILFKAKRLDNGEWVEGYYYKRPSLERNEQHYILYPKFIDECMPYPTWYFEIDPNTLCQFTGMTDKDGNKIWENDIIESQKFSTRPFSKKSKYKRLIGVVEYHTCIFENSNQIYKAEWKVKFNEEDINKYPYSSWSDFWDCKVISNKFDNPELLKEGN